MAKLRLSAWGIYVIAARDLALKVFRENAIRLFALEERLAGSLQ